MKFMYFYCHVYVFLLYVPVSPSCQLALFGYPDWGFSVLFLSCKANARVKPAKMGHGLHSSKLFVLFCVLFACKCVPYYCHRVATQLQLTNMSYIIYQSRITPVSINFIPRYMFRHKLQTIIGPTINADTGKLYAAYEGDIHFHVKNILQIYSIV